MQFERAPADARTLAYFLYLWMSKNSLTMKKEIPVLLLTGYLGAGKTTLLNRILTNERNIRFAVIVNDIGEVNIDASLIQKGGIVGQDKNAGDLIALQNGCICCSLKMDLVNQIADIIAADRFDYIVIEASGICEPEPIARTIASFGQTVRPLKLNTLPRLDAIVSVVDALRLVDEFGGGDTLTSHDLAEDDIANLVIEQIEFTNMILLNKISEVTKEQAEHLHAILHAIQPKARIVDCDYCDVPFDTLLNTHLFDYEKTATSAAWVEKLEELPDEEQEKEARQHHHDHDEHEHEHHCHDGHEEHEHHDHDEHGHHHHHDHEHGQGHEHGDEYGIGTFVYYRRDPFDLNKFDYLAAKHWPDSVIRAKGVVYFSNEQDMSYIFEQAGRQKKITPSGYWYATAPADELAQFMAADPGLQHDWDEKYGDRMIKLVIIGRHMDREAITAALDACLTPFKPRERL